MPKRALTGLVVSNKMDKTGVIKVNSVKSHRIYGKPIKVSKKYKFHDTDNLCNVGDLVTIEESKPISKDKKWRLLKVIEKAGE